MKKLMFVFVLLISSSLFAQKPAKLTVNYKFLNIQEGYDHQTKTQVYIDGALVGESTPHIQSVPTKISLKVPKGQHEIRVVNMTFYNGNWEERSIANGYSTEGSYKSNSLFQKKHALSITFDLNQAEPIIIFK